MANNYTDPTGKSYSMGALGIPIPNPTRPDWQVPIGGGAASGTKPVAPPIMNTGPSATAAAIGAGQMAAGQLPGYNASLANVGANIQSETAGQLPADVIAQLSQQGAERGVAIGAPGSANAGSGLLRALGLTSLDLTNRGQSNLQSILPSLPGYSLSQNPGFYVTPEQQYEQALQQNIFAAAPDPSAVAAANLAAVRGGFSAGSGSIGGAAPRPLPNDTSAFMAGAGGPAPAQVYGANPATAGTYIGGVWYPDGKGPSQNSGMLNSLIQAYAPDTRGDFPDTNTDTGEEMFA